MSLAIAALLFAAPPGVEPPKSGPIDFRCDGMQVLSKPSRVLCKGNVVVRRADLLVCCSLFEGHADEQGGWERFVCSDDVRAQRPGERAWAGKATFVVASGDLVLTGRPVLQRGKSLLLGDTITIDTKSDHARVDRPKGHVEPAEQAPPETPPPAGPVPASCPVPPPLRKR